MSVDVELDEGVATVTLNRPETRNALSDGFLEELVDQLQALDRSREVGCIVIAGQQRFFSAGADLGELAAREPIEIFLGRRAELWRAVREVRVPLVAAVSGHCLGGGCELALSCDMIVASRTARFGQPETGLGLIPGGGGSPLLVRLVGRAVAADMVLTGRRLSAEEAHERGVVARLSDEGDWLDQARAVATEIASRPRVGQLLAKQVLSAALELPLSGGIAFERASYQVALASSDAREGLAAFTGNRDPVWRGR
ncbi:MAG: Enoyl-CoA hydratase/isomerase [Conexibacter sp.]|jgi:enoyl-CoA hydratase|nr:Enoyl-CoA hydratase/isomerase [Conexibacter sp.]